MRDSFQQYRLAVNNHNSISCPYRICITNNQSISYAELICFRYPLRLCEFPSTWQTNGFLSLAQSACVSAALFSTLKTRQRTIDGLPSGIFPQSRLLFTSEGVNNLLVEHQENVRSTSQAVPSLLPVVQTHANPKSTM